MRWLRMMPLVLLLATACNGDDGGQNGAAATRGETPAVMADLLAPVRAVSIAEIEATEAAAQKSQNQAIRQYAGIVATDHRALVGILDSIAQASGAQITVTPSARELDELVRTAHSTAQDMTGFDFDATFVRAEVEAQRQLLDRIDQDLLPLAAQPETQTLLRDIRTMVDAHNLRARQLLGVLATAPDPAAAPVGTAPATTPATRPPPRPTPPAFVPTVVDSPRPPVTTGPPVIPIPIPITTSGDDQ